MSSPVYRAGRSPLRRFGSPGSLAASGLLIGALACGPAGDDAAGGGPGTSETGSVPRSAAAIEPGEMTPGTGTLRLGAETYTFRVLFCDLEAADEDDQILRGSGTTADGRPLRVTLELSPGNLRGEGEVQDAFVMLGSMQEAESWSVKRRRGLNEAWYVGEVSSERAPGPLIEIDGRTVAVAATLTADGGADPREAEIRAACPE